MPSATVSVEQCPFFECKVITDTTDDTEEIPENLLGTFALSPKDWQKAQEDNPILRSIISSLQTSTRVSASRTQADSSIDCRYLKDWDRYFLAEDGVLYRKANINELEFRQLVIPLEYRDIVLRTLRCDLGHQGRDPTISLIKNVSFGQALTPTSGTE